MAVVEVDRGWGTGTLWRLKQRKNKESEKVEEGKEERNKKSKRIS